MNGRLLTSVILLALANANTSASPPPQPDGDIDVTAVTYTVNSAADADDDNQGNGVCHTAGGVCTLRAAIQEAELDGTASTIQFSAPMTITPGSSLPNLMEDNTYIDASNLWSGSWPNGSPGVHIQHNNNSLGILTIGGSFCTIQGLKISGSNSVGVYSQGYYNTIGGTGVGQRNVFVGLDTGIRIYGYHHTIVGNYIGTPDGLTVDANRKGIHTQEGSSNMVNDNLIGGNTDYGIYAWLFSDQNTISNNVIGVNRMLNGPLPNGVGIYVAESRTTISGNIIAGSTSHGVYLLNGGILVQDNAIGTECCGLANGGDGIHVPGEAAYSGPSNNRFLDNRIAGNTGHGIWLRSTDQTTIQGNTIVSNGGDGIHLEEYTGPGPAGADTNAQIGGTGSGEGNVIGSNAGNGIRLSGSMTTTVVGNNIGLDGTGTLDWGNSGYGILLDNGATRANIGGSLFGSDNWISNNDLGGIYLTGSDTSQNYILGNVVGAPTDWSAPAGNGLHGIALYDGAHDNWIGNWFIGNVVLSSGWSGIALRDSPNNTLLSNYVGTNGAGVNWGNAYYGVHVVNGSGNMLAENEVAYNGTVNGLDTAQTGVRVEGATAVGNQISQNSIHDNDGPGIQLVSGGNNNLPAPTITGASCSGPVTGTACAGCRVEIFSDSADEGRVYEGFTDATAGGSFSWTGTPNGPNITATASDTTGNTSPFSAASYVGVCNTAPTASFTVTPGSGDLNTDFQMNASACSDVEDATANLQVRWDWDNNGNYDTGWTTTKTAVHTFVITGNHTIRLQVQDSGGLLDVTTRQVPVSYASRQYLPSVMR